MRRALLAGILGVAILGVCGLEQAGASCCGVARCHQCRCCTPCCQQCCTVMQTCQETVYEEQQQTFYNTVYEDKVEEKTVPSVRYEENVQYHCVASTVWQPKPPTSCGPVNTCGPCAPACQEMVPVQICRKVPFTGYRPVSTQEVVKVKHVVATQVPYTVTVCIPKIVTRQVPVQVCCPTPCCCGKAQPVSAPCGCGK